MNPQSRARRFPVRPELVILVLVVAGCASTTATPSPSVAAPSAAAVASVEPSTSAETSPSASPVPAPSATPAASPLAADFTSASVGSAQPPWTGITWTPIATDDPLGTVDGMVAAPAGGYVAWADPVATGDSSASPLWSSTDGATWHALPADTLGPAAVVIAAGPAGGTLVALTLQGGLNSCTDGTMPECWTLAAPLQAWTSPDGVTWTPSTAPDITLATDCGSDCSVDVPSVAFGGPGVLVMEASGDSRQLALSTDGASWTALPATALPAGFQIGGIAGTPSELVAGGDNGKDPSRAEVATSTDGVTWTTELLRGQGHPAEGSSAGRLFVAADGVLLTGATQDAPGGDLWWSKPDAGTWQFEDGYPPLGVWSGQGEGSGQLPDGTVVADGMRLFALRTDGSVKAWTSTDGATWASIPSSGLKAQPKGSWPIRDMRMIPAGVIATEDSGARWFGAPTQGG